MNLLAALVELTVHSQSCRFFQSVQVTRARGQLGGLVALGTELRGGAGPVRGFLTAGPRQR